VCVAAVGLLTTAPSLLTLATALKTRLRSPASPSKRAPVCGDDPFRTVKFRTAQRRRDALPPSVRRIHLRDNDYLQLAAEER